jgi:hypothetical protein
LTSIETPLVVEGEPGVLPEGYLRDFISGLPVRATPEEVEAVQVFARRLVDDFGYPAEHTGLVLSFTSVRGRLIHAARIRSTLLSSTPPSRARPIFRLLSSASVRTGVKAVSNSKST